MPGSRRFTPALWTVAAALRAGGPAWSGAALQWRPGRRRTAGLAAPALPGRALLLHPTAAVSHASAALLRDCRFPAQGTTPTPRSSCASRPASEPRGCAASAATADCVRTTWSSSAAGSVVEDGQWIARPDLSYPWLRIAIEYDGDPHRTSRQWRSDRARRHLLEDAGWVVLQFTADDVLRRPEATVERVRRAIAGRG